MQSVVQYTRIFARALFTGIGAEVQPQWGNHQQQRRKQNLQLVTASSGISKTQRTSQFAKKWSFGDDACFVATHKLADVIGVADGVGGWRQYGVDPSTFPKYLMMTCERMVKEGRFSPQKPNDLLSDSYQEVLEAKSPLLGSCTACIVSLSREEKTVYAANLGDSGFRIIREGKMVHWSEEQQHYFNTPFQLAVAPSTLQGMVFSDSPDVADSTSFGVKEGDIILVGTDGLFDNLNEDMILNHISQLKSDDKPESIQKVANALAKHAYQLAFDPDYMSPFALEAQANGMDMKGGKPDDITVLLARVTDNTTEGQ